MACPRIQRKHRSDRRGAHGAGEDRLADLLPGRAAPLLRVDALEEVAKASPPTPFQASCPASIGPAAEGGGVIWLAVVASLPIFGEIVMCLNIAGRSSTFWSS